MSPVVRKKKTGVKIPDRYVLLITAVLSVLLIVGSYFIPAVGRPFRAVGDRLVVPFQEGISRVGRHLSARAQLLRDMEDLLAENAELREKVDELTLENLALSQDRYELQSLRELYKLSGSYSDYETVGARIIARDTSNYYHSFLIDKGEEDGLTLDMNVMAQGGLVGRIDAIGPHWSRVLCIIDDDSNLAGEVLSTSDQLIVSGSLENYDNGVILFSRLIDRKDAVGIGDKIVTSNISDKYLPGILVGYILTLEKDSNNLTKSGTLTPAVDFEHLSTVLVITTTREERVSP